MLSIMLSGNCENWQSSSIHNDIIDIFRFMFIIRYSFSHQYYLIYLTLHWPFLINLRLCSLSINIYEYSCHTIWAGLFNALFIWLIYGKVAQWFLAVNHDIMGSNPAETVFFSRILIKSSFCQFCLHIFHVFTYLKSLQCTYILHHI